MEQKAKSDWDLNHFGDPNPYAGLPRLNIFTFDLGKVLAGFDDVEDSAFNFKEFSELGQETLNVITEQCRRVHLANSSMKNM